MQLSEGDYQALLSRARPCRCVRPQLRVESRFEFPPGVLVAMVCCDGCNEEVVPKHVLVRRPPRPIGVVSGRRMR